MWFYHAGLQNVPNSSSFFNRWSHPLNTLGKSQNLLKVWVGDCFCSIFMSISPFHPPEGFGKHWISARQLVACSRDGSDGSTKAKTSIGKRWIPQLWCFHGCFFRVFGSWTSFIHRKLLGCLHRFPVRGIVINFSNRGRRNCFNFRVVTTLYPPEVFFQFAKKLQLWDMEPEPGCTIIV